MDHPLGHYLSSSILTENNNVMSILTRAKEYLDKGNFDGAWEEIGKVINGQRLESYQQQHVDDLRSRLMERQEEKKIVDAKKQATNTAVRATVQSQQLPAIPHKYRKAMQLRQSAAQRDAKSEEERARRRSERSPQKRVDGSKETTDKELQISRGEVWHCFKIFFEKHGSSQEVIDAGRKFCKGITPETSAKKLWRPFLEMLHSVPNPVERDGFQKYVVTVLEARGVLIEEECEAWRNFNITDSE